MASDHPVLDAVDHLERGVGNFLSHHRTIEEYLMSKVQELSAMLKELVPSHHATVAERDDLKAKLETMTADRDTQKERADTAEATIAENEATAGSDLDAVKAELSAESRAPSQGSGSDSEPSTPVVTTPSAGVTVTVDPTAGTTTHEDATTGVTTTVDHATGDATATTASGQTVEPNPADVETAVSSAAAAGVTVPAAGN